jgi:topoisomerase IV subunit A
MSENEELNNETTNDDIANESISNNTQDEDLHHSEYKPTDNNEDTKHHLSGMYRNWFLDYASYVNLDRAIPHINDGLKPVQRRVLHAMKRMDDGRYNKVANIVGHTMQFHPHGDASIGCALVTLGQKELLIDTQGNWGNILTGDSAAAPRYIEARLTKLALETVFNPKTTVFTPSYDGRNKEPVTLPVKFPLLLAQGMEGIGLGLNSRILPHNFNELIDASIAYLEHNPFQVYPDFPTGGMIDISRYNDGERGGKVRIRAKIEKLDNKTLAITEVPYGITTGNLIESILKANEKGKINIKHVDDNTAANVEILVHLEAKTSSDKTIDALYAFTQCELTYSPNCCVIDDNKPQFITVSDVLKRNTDNTLSLLNQELEIQKSELIEQLFYASLEKLFIEQRIYKDKEFENASSTDIALDHIDKRLEPFKKDFVRDIQREDLQKLLEIRMARILKFNTDKASENILALQQQIKEVENNIANIVPYTINWFKHLKSTYGEKYPRKTEIRNFENIEAAKVVEANERLYMNREEGFIGTALKKDEYVCNCSDIDDLIVFFKNGKYKVVKVADKMFVGKDIIHVAIFIKNDKRTVYNVIYRDGRNGSYFIKRFFVNSITRDKEYDVTKGTEGSRIIYFSANPNGEAETIRVYLRPTTRRIKKLIFEKDFCDISIKGRQSMGNLLTKFAVHKIVLKQKGGSTLGGTDIYFDADVQRLNMDKRGIHLGEFFPDDQILVIYKNGDYCTTSFDLNNHYDDGIARIEKFDSNKIWSIALYDADQQYYYIKRFQLEPSAKTQSILGTNAESLMSVVSDQVYPRFQVTMGGGDSFREDLIIDVDEFIAVKSVKAKGKRITTWQVAEIKELEPIKFPEPVPDTTGESEEEEEETLDNDNEKSEEKVTNSKIKEKEEKEKEEDKSEEKAPFIEEKKAERTEIDINDIDDITGQMTLF